MRRARRGRALATLSLAIALGCAGATSRAEPPAAPAPAPSPAPSPEAVESLQALGYAGFDASSAAQPQAGVRVIDAARSYPGYLLYTNPVLCSAMLIDHVGVVVKSWQGQPCGRWFHARLLESGNLLVPGSDASDEDEGSAELGRRYLTELDWNGRVLWRRSLAVHHDVAPAVDGLVALIVAERILPAIDGAVPVRDNRVARLDARGNVLESVSLYDLFSASEGRVRLLPLRKVKKGGIDLFHANAVEWWNRAPTSFGLAERDSGPCALVTVRHQNAILLISWSSRRIVWAWGQDTLAGPHDASVLANGHVLVFDNGLGRGQSRVLEIDPSSGGIVWQYDGGNAAPGSAAGFYTASRGSAERLPNGNTMIAESDRGHAFEVTPKGDLVWEFWNPARNAKGERAAIVRMNRVPTEWVERLRAAAP